MSKGERTVIKFSGDNEELFKRITADDFCVDTVVIVPTTHYAVLVKNGIDMGVLDSGDHPVFDKFGMFGGKKDKTVYSVDIIFMSKTVKVRVLWGTRTQFDLRDCETGVPIKLGAHGEFEVQIDNPLKFYHEVVGVERNYTVAMLKERLTGRIMGVLEPAIAKAMNERSLSYDRMGEHKQEIALQLQKTTDEMFRREYGLKVFSFTIAKIVLSDDDIRAIADARLRKAGGTVGSGVQICPGCGATCRSDAKFCDRCGKSVSSGGPVCDCGAQNAVGAYFCGACGKKLG